MDKLVISGGLPLRGTVEISGAKNAALPILVGTVLTGAKCTIENVPDILDVDLTLEILEKMGARIVRRHNTVEIDTADVRPGTSPSDLVCKMRGSTYLIGAELGRFLYAKVGSSGGCDFGARPIDQHIKGFEALGASVDARGYFVEAKAEKLVGREIYFDLVSVGATINAILASVFAEGVTVLENAAREPHVVDLANFLNACGANVVGAGTDTIKIKGVKQLHGATYAIIPDMIEAGTYMFAAAATHGRVKINNVIPKHLDSISAKLSEMGVAVEELDDAIIVDATGPLAAINVKTRPYPGFPTDMHPQMTALLCFATGTGRVTEDVYDNRFRYVEELRKTGANIAVSGKTATVEGCGGEGLVGAPMKSVDLRGGAAMVIMGLAVSGRTEITEIHTIERGYNDIVRKLTALGADIRKIAY
ncbi:MAG: UDP-N-acetylglucosamine 1-carboxyvinyltransferase [Clostridia bacterium]|nr:UDP-N-acetylglucosamine 1-carboxyvinyltransferase [Clostridia bacterium]